MIINEDNGIHFILGVGLTKVYLWLRLSHQCQKEIGIPPGEYLRRARVNEARRLLIEPCSGATGRVKMRFSHHRFSLSLSDPKPKQHDGKSKEYSIQVAILGNILRRRIGDE